MGNAMKTVKARHNETVFHPVSSGIYEAKLFGYDVVLTRMTHKLWECRVASGTDEGKLLAVAETRTKAMIEAYENVKRGEAHRLDWVLRDEPLRQYGKRGQYNTDIDIPEQKTRKERAEDTVKKYVETQPSLRLVDTQTTSQDDEPEEEKAQPMSGSLRELLTPEQLLIFRKFWKVRKNSSKGTFAAVKIDSFGKPVHLQDGFETAGDAHEYILDFEGFLSNIEQ